jgi:predicted amidophosphoribosyltransferase
LAEACDAFVSVFFPASCRICDECLASFVPVAEKVCEICGRPMHATTKVDEERLLCPICREHPGQQGRTYAFNRARSNAAYDGALVRAILLLKFERMEPLGA